MTVVIYQDTGKRVAHFVTMYATDRQRQRQNSMAKTGSAVTWKNVTVNKAQYAL